MNQAFGRPRRHRGPSINLASLIDVMFLLIIFFSVSTVFQTGTGLDIALPTAATSAEQQEAPHEIFVQETGVIRFGEAGELTLEALEEQLRRLQAENPEARVALSADENADFKHIIAVMDAARKVGGRQLIIRTQLPDQGGADPTNP